VRADGGIKERGYQEDWYNMGTNISTELLNYTESHLSRQLHSSFCANLKYHFHIYNQQTYYILHFIWPKWRNCKERPLFLTDKIILDT